VLWHLTIDTAHGAIIDRARCSAAALAYMRSAAIAAAGAARNC